MSIRSTLLGIGSLVLVSLPTPSLAADVIFMCFYGADNPNSDWDTFFEGGDSASMTAAWWACYHSGGNAVVWLDDRYIYGP